MADIELGGWNLPEAAATPAEPVPTADYSGFEL